MEVSMAKSKKIKKHRKFWLVVKILILVILLTVLGGGLFLYLKYGDEVIGMQQERTCCPVYGRYIPQF